MADCIAAVPRYPGADERVLARSVVRAGGGPASTAAVAAARAGAARVAFVGTVGDDVAGQELLTELRAEGIDVDGVTRLSEVATGSSVIVVDLAAGTRAISALPGPAVQLNDVATAQIRSARWVHTDHLGWAATTRALAGLTERPRLSVDISYPVEGFSPAGVDLYVPNLAAATARYPEAAGNLEELLDRALAEGAGTVVITRGGDGSAAAGPDGARHLVQAHRSPVLSTLGAGDVFHGALLAAVDAGQPLPEAMRYAGAVAALSCRALDGRGAIPTHAQTLAALAGTTG